MAGIHVSIKESAVAAGFKHAQHLVEALANAFHNEVVAQMDPGPQRTGRRYRVRGTGVIDKETGALKPETGTIYTASAPGEPPAVQTGTYVGRWQVLPAVIVNEVVTAFAVNDARTEDGQLLGDILEFGTARIAPRPHIRPALENVKQRFNLT